MRASIRSGLLLPLFALLLAGCGSSMFRQPQVTLENVTIGGLGLRGGTLLVDLQVVNPNRFALHANQLHYHLELRDPAEAGDTTWVDFARGVYDQPFSVGAGATSRVQIPIEFSYSGMGGAANSVLRSGTFTYRATGTVSARTPLGGHTVPFTRRGTVTLMGTR